MTQSPIGSVQRTGALHRLQSARAELARLLRIRGAHRRTARRIARARLELALAALALALATPVYAGTLPPPPRFLDPFRPYGLGQVEYSAHPTFADVDGDGDLDAFVGGEYSLPFFENTGTAFAPAFATGVPDAFGLVSPGYSVAPALADLDGDGDLDAILTSYAHVDFFRNTGTVAAPLFAAPLHEPFGLVPVFGVTPVFADLDRDEDLDALFPEQDGDGVLHFENTGSVTSPAFASPINPFGLSAPGYGDVHVLDLDGDGDLDLHTRSYDGDRLYFENTGGAGQPAFAAALTNPFGLPSQDSGSAFADLDGDGDIDLLSHGPSLGFFENTGTQQSPAFAPAADPLGLEGLPIFGDMDGDGDLDAFVDSYDEGIGIATNTGSATAPAFAPLVTGPFGLPSNGWIPQPVDLDDDGDLDLVKLASSGQLVYFRNSGSTTAPAFDDALEDPFGLGAIDRDGTPVFADLDGDGDLDALTLRYATGVLFHENVGTKTNPDFESDLNPFGLDAGTIRGLAMGDLDGDGDLDAVASRSFGFAVLIDEGGPTAQFVSGPIFRAGVDGRPALADHDGDGDLDLFVGTSWGATALVENTGSAAAPAFRPPIDPFGLDRVSGSRFADIDGDGDYDVFGGDYDPGVRFGENVGSPNAPSFVSRPTDPFGIIPVGQYSIPLFGDLDGDGDLDLVVGSYQDVVYFANTGSALAPAFAAVDPDPPWLPGFGFDDDPSLADVDGDGDLDLWGGSFQFDDVVVRENTGTSAAPAFAGPVANPFGLSVYEGIPSFADIDGDGDLDALVHAYDGEMVFFANTGGAGAPAFAEPVTNPFGLGSFGDSSRASFLDLDGDGDLDGLIPGGGGLAFFENLAIDFACPAAPDPACTTGFAKGSLLVDARKAGKERLTARWLGGPPPAPGAFGDPLSASRSLVCLYDDEGTGVGALAVAPGAGWKAIGTTGFRYADRTGASNGVRALALRGGRKTELSCNAANRAKRGQAGLPRNVASALADASSVTMQLHSGPDACFSTTLTDIKKQTDTLFKAK